MKRGLRWSLGLALIAATFLHVGGRSQEAPAQPKDAPPTPDFETNTISPPPLAAGQEPASGEQNAEGALAEAAVRPISTVKPLPANIQPAGALAVVIKLANSGVDESVLMAYVTNSPSPFHLGVEEILYLNDIGFPGPAVTAMMQRDQALKALSANAGPEPAAPAEVASASQFPPDSGMPASYAPQPTTAPAPPEMPPEAPPPGDYAAGDYPPPPPEDTGYSTFYDSLAPYGTWVDVGGYGPCWQPSAVVANPAWQPYCDAGRWVYTDCGWYWQSGYTWGWAPFHYGRWFRHNRLGWCWAPDTVWGPSWVCWRYGGGYCGWAPLPPGAWYRPGVGLTYHGRHVNGSFGFGLGIKSYAFVEVSHFRDPHLNRHALPLPQAAQVYHTTSTAVTIGGNSQHIVNRGIPVGRVAAATGTQIHPVALREVNAPVAPGARAKQLEATSRTMTTGRPAPTAKAAAPTVTSSARTISPGRSDPAPRSAAPLILHGPDRPGQGTTGGSAGAVKEAYPPNALVVIGRKEGNPQRTGRPSSAWTTQTSPSRPTALAQDALPRPAANQRPQPVTTSAWGTPARSEPARSAPRPPDPPARTERQWQYPARTYQEPAEARWSAPAPAFAPQPMRSYSPSAVSSPPRASAMESRPTPAPPPARAASAPSGQSHSSSDRSGR